MNDKAPGAFRTISEVADDLNLPQHVLRFWESRFHEIAPMKRGGGRRYYRPSDIDLLRGIRHLLYGEGYTIRGVQRLLREQGVKFVQSVWRNDEVPSPVEFMDDVDERGGGYVNVSDEVANEEAIRTDSGSKSDFDEQVFFDDRREPLFEAAMPSSASVMTSGSSVATSRSNETFGADDLYKLQAALKELMECRKLITATCSMYGAGRNSEA